MAGPFLYNLITKVFYELKDGFTVGRGSGELTLPDDGKLSRAHCKFKVEGPIVQIEDLKSTNGTVIDGKKLFPNTPTDVRQGSLIEVGNQRLYFTTTKNVPTVSMESDDVAPDYAVDESGDATRRIKRKNRIRIHPARGVTFVTDSGQTLAVSNLSQTGLALVRTTPDRAPEAGGPVIGTLTLKEGGKIALKTKVVRKSPTIIGVLLDGDVTEFRKFLIRNFSIELTAATLLKTEEINFGVAPGMIPSRFVGDDGAELSYSVRSGTGGQIAMWFAVIFGNKLQWDCNQGLMSGSLGADATQMAAVAVRFVEGVTGLDDEIRKSISDELMKIAKKI